MVDSDGAVRSWSNPAHPGYAYPEAAGLVLGALATEPGTEVIRARIASRLARDVDAAGAVGRGGARYAFDTCVCLAGLLAHERAGGVLDDPELPDRMGRAACAMLDRGVCVEGAVDAPAGHWSVSYGCHLLKCAVALTALDERSGDDRHRGTVRALVDALAPLGRGGRFPTHAAATESYLHATLYALEGLGCLRARGWEGFDHTLEDGAVWLATAQDDTGALRAWNDGTRAWGARRSDATAQAMRLWCWHDRARWAPNVARAKAFLTAVQDDSGGLLYEPRSRDVNTWATAFAVQALRWEERAGDARWVL
ncbi:MAG: hypothetical protein KA978_03795 [Deltaproteobacteria bacterium]|nr:hypothetical protein [Deltaproteobacteria bacterium]